ncbi:peptidase S10 [Paenibacillus sp. YSY-4.3]
MNTRKKGHKLLIAGVVAATLIAGSSLPYNVMAKNVQTVSISNVPSYTKYNLTDPTRFVTDHEVTINGVKIAYQVTAGETYLYNLKGELTASMFSYSYIKKGNDSNRPVAFVFNGGPGSSSLWLHMGIIGPRKVVLSNDVNPKVTPPFNIKDNNNSLLDVADLVFIDPVGTGYSRAVGVGENKDFFGIDQDAEAFAQFIDQWLTEHGRWNSPKYLVGESYGSVRASILPNALMGGPTTAGGVFRGISVNGIILLGTTLGGTNPDKELETALSLPSIAATAWYHNKSGFQNMSLEELDKQAFKFAKEVYHPAIVKEANKQLGSKERKEIVSQLSKYTGLPEQSFKDSIAVTSAAFSKQMLAKEGSHIGLYDSRYTLPSNGDGYEPVADDAAMGQYTPAFTAAFHQMQKDELKVSMDTPYNSIVWQDLNFAWDTTRKGKIPSQGYANELSSAMRRNADLKVFVASGYYDLVTTPASAKNALDESTVPKDRVFYRNYESGHMLYIGKTADQFSKDTHRFIENGNVSTE